MATSILLLFFTTIFLTSANACFLSNCVAHGRGRLRVAQSLPVPEAPSAGNPPEPRNETVYNPRIYKTMDIEPFAKSTLFLEIMREYDQRVKPLGSTASLNDLIKKFIEAERSVLQQQQNRRNDIAPVGWKKLRERI